MDVNSILRSAVRRSLLGFIVILSLLATPALAVEYQDSQIFISGFNAYQSKDYQGAIDKMSQVLQKYPDTPLRDMAIFWLARAHFKAGHRKEAAQYMAQFFHDYPDSPLKSTVEPGLAKLAVAYAKGEPLPMAEAQEEGKPVATKVAAEKTAKEKSEADRLATEKAAAEKAEADRLAAEKAASEKLAAEKTEADRLATEKAAAEKAAAEKQATEKLAAEAVTTEKATAEKAAADKAWEERVAAEKAAAEKAEARKATAEKLATEKAAAKAEKAAARKAAAEKLAAAKAAAKAEKAAARKAAAEKLAAEKTERAAARKAAAEELAAEKAAAKAEKVAARKAATERLAAEKAAAPARAGSAAAMRDKAIAGYRSVIDRYPGSHAASIAAARLKELGAFYRSAGSRAGAGGSAQVMTLEVEQYADFALNMPPEAQSYAAGSRFSIPIEVVNQGNGVDSFSLESGFPSEFDLRFASSATPDVPVTVTPQLLPGETFKGVLTGVIPRSSIDGQKSVFPIKVASQFARDLSHSREISLAASAPLLRAVIKPDKGSVLPGEKVVYHIALLNAGSAAASSVTFRLDYSPLYEPVEPIVSGFRQGARGVLVIDGQRINSGESREFTVAFQLKEDAPARQELILRGDVINSELERKESFLSTATVVQGVSGVTARANAEKVVVIPGQTLTIPIVVINTGNIRELFRVSADLPSGVACRYVQDLKRDGNITAGATPITTIGPLEPREEAYLLMELTTQTGAADGSEAQVRSLIESDSDKGTNATVTVSLRFARPIVELAMSGKGSKLKPGEISSYEFNVVNRGSNLAKAVEIRSILPENLEMLAADITPQKGSGDESIWRFAELGAGEKRSVRITFRVKAGIPVGTNIQIKNLVTYEDQLGNRY